jgi:hypothetical protein
MQVLRKDEAVSVLIVKTGRANAFVSRSLA